MEIEPATNAFVAGAFKLITREEPRLSRPQLAQALVNFCRDVDEFWAWVPTVDSFARWFGLGDEAPELYRRCWDIDLQMIRALVSPWPAGWPERLNDLQRAAVAAGVQPPARAVNHLHPRVHAEWNRQLFTLIRAAQGE